MTNRCDYRYRESHAVVDELDMLHRRYGLDEFEFIEDTFTCVPERVRELMSLLRPRGFRWSCQGTVPDLIKDPGLVHEMVAAGCRGLFFGIESGNDEVLRRIKNMSRASILETMDRVQTAGIRHLVASFIIGHPWDTRATISDTVELMQVLRDRGAHTPVSILVPFPGSPIGKWPERFGVTVHSHDYTEYYNNRALISTEHLSRSDLEDLYFDVLEQIVAS